MGRRDPPVRRQERVPSSQSEKLRITGTSSTSKSEGEDNDDNKSIPSPSNLSILEDLQHTGIPTKRNVVLARPPPKKHNKMVDVERGDDDCTAAFILDAIVDTTNPLKSGGESNEKKTVLLSSDNRQESILEDLASAERMTKEETNVTLFIFRRPWVFAVIVVLTIVAFGILGGALWS